MKLHLMKAFIITAILLLCIGFIACEKESIEESSLPSTVNSDFYRHKKAGGDEYKNFVLDFLAHVDDSIPFTGNFVATYGLPQWDLTSSYGVGEIPSLIVPVYDEENSTLSSLLYFVLEDGRFDYYLLMNDRDDIAYEKSKRLIQYYELTLGLEQSNTDFFIKIDSKKGNTKTYRTQVIECYYYYVGTVDDPYQELHGHDCVASAAYEFETDRGEWNSDIMGTGSTTEDPKPANGGGDTDNSDPDANPAPDVEEDPSFISNPCASQILFSLKSGISGAKYDMLKDQFIGQNNLAANILSFFENSTEFNITYKIGSIEGNGYCNKIDNSRSNYEIIINNNYVNSATNLSIARTIIHETIHAHLLYITYGMQYEERQNSKEWVALQEIFNGPLAGDRSNNTIQHEYMTGIVNLISNCLYDWAYKNNLNIDRTYCWNLAWGGLQNTQVYETKVKNRELNNSTITQILLTEQNNELNAKGEPCTE